MRTMLIILVIVFLGSCSPRIPVTEPEKVDMKIKWAKKFARQNSTKGDHRAFTFCVFGAASLAVFVIGRWDEP